MRSVPELEMKLEAPPSSFIVRVADREDPLRIDDETGGAEKEDELVRAIRIVEENLHRPAAP